MSDAKKLWADEERQTLAYETIGKLALAIDECRVEIVIPTELCYETLMALSIAGGYPMSNQLRAFVRSLLEAMPGLDALERARLVEVMGFEKKAVGR